MNKTTLSPRVINSLKRNTTGPKSQRLWVPEFKGLGIDLGKSKRSFILKFKSPVTGKYRITTLESYTYSQTITQDDVEDIREDYHEKRKQIRAGIDPLQAKEDTREARRQAVLAQKKEQDKQAVQSAKQAYTLDRAFDAYTRKRLFTHDIAEATQTRYIQCYNTHISPVMGKTPILDIEPHHIDDFLDGLNDSTCNMAIPIFNRIQQIAFKSKKIPRPFCYDMKMRVIVERKTVIEDLPGFIDFLNSDHYRSYKNALMAQLLYATRANEIYQLRWDEVLEDEIHIPWTRIKTRRIAKKQTEPLIIPILPAMRTILNEQQGCSNETVFPMLSKDKAVTNCVVYCFLKDNEFNFSSHDIRRTVSVTLRNKLAASVDDINVVLDHALDAVSKAYLPGTPLEIKRKVLLKWHLHLTEIMNPDVVSIEKHKHV